MSWQAAVSNALLGVLVFGFSASVDVDSFRDKLKRKNGILIGLSCQFFLLPFIGFSIVKIFDLDQVYGITLLVVTSSPGGSYSNWWCSLFNADLALSIAMTTASTIISAFMLPINLLIYITAAYQGGNAHAHLNWAALGTSIGVVIGGVLLGLFCAKKSSPKWKDRANKLGNLAGISLILFSFYFTSRDEPIWNRTAVFYVAVALPCLMALALALGLTSMPKCGLEKPERVSVAIETCYQNVGIATAVALSMFKGSDRSKAVGVPLYYGVVEAVTLALFCIVAWQLGWTFAPRTDNIFKVLAGNYQHQSSQRDPSSVEGTGEAPMDPQRGGSSVSANEPSIHDFAEKYKQEQASDESRILNIQASSDEITDPRLRQHQQHQEGS